MLDSSAGAERESRRFRKDPSTGHLGAKRFLRNGVVGGNGDARAIREASGVLLRVRIVNARSAWRHYR